MHFWVHENRRRIQKNWKPKEEEIDFGSNWFPKYDVCLKKLLRNDKSLVILLNLERLDHHVTTVFGSGKFFELHDEHTQEPDSQSSSLRYNHN